MSLPQHSKGHIHKPTANIILNVEKLKEFLLRQRKRKGFNTFISPILLNNVLEALASEIREEKKKNKRNPDWKRSKALTV